MKLRQPLLFSVICFLSVACTSHGNNNADIALTPPMGWNSYDCFGHLVTEADVKANADYMAAHLKEYGWEYIVVDYLWYAEGLTSANIRLENPPQHIDEYGRLIPSPTLHPSSANGRGFKPLADYVHAKGLKFGIHIMRGIPYQAIKKNTPVKGTKVRASEIANQQDTCSWYQGLCGVDMTRPGAQEYYNSLLELYASWGVDFIKADDMSSPYHADEIEALQRAIQHSGRKIILSLSPGPTFIGNPRHVSTHAQMWRISGDFWDEWSKLRHQFDLCRMWAPFTGPGHWPDADMLPIGQLSIRTDIPELTPRRSRFTPDELKTMMTLWCMFRSPLMIGGNLPDMTPEELSLLTNKEVIAINQKTSNNQEIYRSENVIVWCAEYPSSQDFALAFFDTGEQEIRFRPEISSYGLNGKFMTTNLWNKEVVSPEEILIPPHGCVLLKFQKI
ncbi:MAG: alpha-galactosidase [Bacteroidales bacterium]